MWGLTKHIVGPFDDLAAANAWAAANPGDLYVGLLASVNGTQYTYGAAGAGWVGGASALSAPPASGDFVGQLIWVVNPAVPRGRSRLEWTGSIWAPPAGELIAQYFSDTYLAQATPGVQPLYKVWQSDIIPDYMLSDLWPFTINAAANIANAGTPVAGCGLMCGISGENPTSVIPPEYFLGLNSFMPASGGSGFLPAVSGFAIRSGTGYRRQNWQGSAQDIQYMGLTQARVITGSLSACKFVAGSNRIYVKAITRSATDVVTVNAIQVRAGF